MSVTINQVGCEVGGFMAAVRTPKKFPFGANLWLRGHEEILKRVRNLRVVEILVAVLATENPTCHTDSYPGCRVD